MPQRISFRGGAGASAASARKRQETQLLAGLKQLLGQINQSEEEKSPNNRSRSPSPGWETKGSRRGRSPGRKGKGKGKGDGMVSHVDTHQTTKRQDSPRSKSPKHVRFQGDDSLLAQLKALVLNSEIHGDGQLLNGLVALVNKFSNHQDTVPKCEPPRKVLENKPKQIRNDYAPKTPGKTKRDRIVLAKNWWPEPITPNATIMDALEMGLAPQGNLTVASYLNAIQYRQLAKTHNIQKVMALIIYDNCEQEAVAANKGERKWCRLQNRWQELTVLPLTDTLPLWPMQPKVITPDQITTTPAELSTIRVILPRRYLTQAQWQQIQTKPNNALTTILPEGTSYRTYGWHQNPLEREEAIIGFLKTPKETAVKILEKSGYGHAFFQQVFLDSDTRPSKPIKWIQFEHESQYHYLQEVRKLAKTQGVGIVIRRGGKSCLGLLGVDSGIAEEMRKKRWVAKGIPHSWLPHAFKELLESQNWRVVSDIQPPKSKYGPWTFSAAPPEQSVPGCVINLQDGKQIMISPWVPNRQSKPQMVPMTKFTKGWVTNNPTPKEAEKISAAAPEVPVAATAQDPPTQPSQQTEAIDVDEMNEHNGSQKRPPVDSPTKQDPAISQAKKKIATTSEDFHLGPDGVRTWNLGGDGDCGFRCMAAIQAQRQKKTKNAIEKNIQTLALSLRSKIATNLETNKSWQEAWWHDPEASEITEGGQPAMQAQDFAETVRRPTKWFDQFCAQAAADVVQTDLIVFKYTSGQWHFMHRYYAKKKSCQYAPAFVFEKTPLHHSGFSGEYPGPLVNSHQ